MAIPVLLGFAVLLLQASALCFTIALPELLSRAYMIGTNTFRYMSVLTLAAVLYIAICAPVTIFVSYLEKRMGRYATTG